MFLSLILSLAVIVRAADYYNQNVGLFNLIAFSGNTGNAIFQSGNKYLATAVEIILPEVKLSGVISKMTISRKFHDKVELDLVVSKEIDGKPRAHTKDGHIDLTSIPSRSLIVLRHIETTEAHMSTIDTKCTICENCNGILNPATRSVFIFPIDDFMLFNDFTELHIFYDNDGSQYKLASYDTSIPNSNKQSLVYPNGSEEFFAALDIRSTSVSPLPTYQNIILPSYTTWKLPSVRHFGRCTRYDELGAAENSLAITSISSEQVKRSLYDKRLYWKISINMGYLKTATSTMNNKRVMFKWLPQDPNDDGYFLHVTGDAFNNNVIKLISTTCVYNAKYSVNICPFETIDLELYAPSIEDDFDKYLDAGGVLPRILISEPTLNNMDDIVTSGSLKTRKGRDSAVSVIDAIDFPFRFGTYTLRVLIDGPCVNPWTRSTDNNSENNESPECQMRRNILAGYDYAPPPGQDIGDMGTSAVAYCEYCQTDSCCCQRLNDYQKETVCQFIYDESIYANSCQKSAKYKDCSGCATAECCTSMSQSVNPMNCYMKDVCVPAPKTCSECGNDNSCCDAIVGECYFLDGCKKLPPSCGDISVEADCKFISNELGCSWQGGSCASNIASCKDCNILMNPFGCCTSSSDELSCNFYKNVCIDNGADCKACNQADAEYTTTCCEFYGSTCGMINGLCQDLPTNCHECMSEPQPKHCCEAAWDGMWCQWMNDNCIADMSKQCSECNYALNPQGCCKSRDYCHYYIDPETAAGGQPLGICERLTQSCEECNTSPFVRECCDLIDGCQLIGRACHVEDYSPPDVCGHEGAVYAGVGFAAASVGLIVVITIMIVHWLTYDTRIQSKEYMGSVPDPTLDTDFYYADAELKPLPLDEDERTALLEATDAGTAGGMTSSSRAFDNVSSKKST